MSNWHQKRVANANAARTRTPRPRKEDADVSMRTRKAEFEADLAFERRTKQGLDRYIEQFVGRTRGSFPGVGR